MTHNLKHYATLNQIPNYHMRVFNLPKKIQTQIDKLNRNFLWGHAKNVKKNHLISWDKVTNLRKDGRLGIKKSSFVNPAFMSKFRWDLHTSKNNPCVKLITHKYNYPLIPTPRRNSSYIFRGIFKDINLCDLNTSHIIRNGATTSLWHDKWITNLTLRNLLIDPFPKEEHLKTVASIISYNSGNPVWNLNSVPLSREYTQHHSSSSLLYNP